MIPMPVIPKWTETHEAEEPTLAANPEDSKLPEEGASGLRILFLTGAMLLGGLLLLLHGCHPHEDTELFGRALSWF
jgi:hypothetical protein